MSTNQKKLDTEEIEYEDEEEEEEEEEEEYEEQEEDEEGDDEEEGDFEVSDEEYEEEIEDVNEEKGDDEDEEGKNNDIELTNDHIILPYYLQTRVPDDERITRNRMSKFEIARVIGTRVQQLIKNAPAFIADIKGKTPVEIALNELINKRLPINIYRPMPYDSYEVWKCSELEVIISEDDIKGLIECIRI